MKAFQIIFTIFFTSFFINNIKSQINTELDAWFYENPELSDYYGRTKFDSTDNQKLNIILSHQQNIYEEEDLLNSKINEIFKDTFLNYWIIYEYCKNLISIYKFDILLKNIALKKYQPRFSFTDIYPVYNALSRSNKRYEFYLFLSTSEYLMLYDLEMEQAFLIKQFIPDIDMFKDFAFKSAGLFNLQRTDVLKSNLQKIATVSLNLIGNKLIYK